MINAFFRKHRESESKFKIFLRTINCTLLVSKRLRVFLTVIKNALLQLQIKRRVWNMNKAVQPLYQPINVNKNRVLKQRAKGKKLRMRNLTRK